MGVERTVLWSDQAIGNVEMMKSFVLQRIYIWTMTQRRPTIMTWNLRVWAVLMGGLLATAGSAQFKFIDGERVLIDTVLTIDSIPSASLYERGKEWMLRNLKSSDSNVSLDDEAQSKLIGTTNLLLSDKKGVAWSYYTDRVINFKISIFTKDGRYRIIVENIVYACIFVNQDSRMLQRHTMEEWFNHLKESQEKGKTKRVVKIDETISELEKAINDLLLSLHTAMIGGSSASESDW